MWKFISRKRYRKPRCFQCWSQTCRRWRRVLWPTWTIFIPCCKFVSDTFIFANERTIDNQTNMLPILQLTKNLCTLQHISARYESIKAKLNFEQVWSSFPIFAYILKHSPQNIRWNFCRFTGSSLWVMKKKKQVCIPFEKQSCSRSTLCASNGLSHFQYVPACNNFQCPIWNR